jgi:hypothetical protein
MAYEAQEIAERLRAARAASGLSQRELSALAGIPQAQISRIEGEPSICASPASSRWRMPWTSSWRSSRARRFPLSGLMTREALRNKAVHGPDPEADEGGARPAYSLDDDHDA